MILLVLFAFLGGIITILSPCILPILPIVLAGSFGSKRKPLGIVMGFVLSFTIFTLFLTTLVKITNIPADILRNFSIIVIFIFGVSLLIPKFQYYIELAFSKLSSRFNPTGTHQGIIGGILIGFSLGLIWTPCVGPIIASVITLAATSTVTLNSVIITFAYAIGTAIPMLIIMIGGRSLLQKVPWLLSNTEKIQKIFGVFMILIAIALYLNFDRSFQTFVLNKFPKYGTNLSFLEDNNLVKDNLSSIKNVAKSNTSSDSLLNENYPAPEITGISNWINLPADKQSLSSSDLKGKVVLVDFWTYTCINCIRTLPHVIEWNDKYKDKGLVIIGVHTPEFEFEKNSSNVKEAIKDFGITYPVAQDNDYKTWNSFNNIYWPAKYLIDSKGNVRYTHFGEGDYDKTEEAIQTLLKEAGNNVNEGVSQMPDETPKTRTSPETYLGSSRMQYYFPNGSTANGEANFLLANNIPVNTFSLGNRWNIMDEYSTAVKNAELKYNFFAKNVYLVMRSKDGKPKKVKIYIDGKPAESNGGKDVVNGEITVTNDRLYNLVNLKSAENREILLKLENGIEVFAFTFG